MNGWFVILVIFLLATLAMIYFGVVKVMVDADVKTKAEATKNIWMNRTDLSTFEFTNDTVKIAWAH